MGTIDRIDAIIKRDFRISSARVPGAVRAETHLFDDLEFDSLDRMELICRVEEEFDVEIGESAIDGINNVGDLVAVIDNARRQ